MSCERCGRGLPGDYLLMTTHQLGAAGRPPYLYCSEQCLVADLLVALEVRPRTSRRLMRALARGNWPIYPRKPEEKS